MILSNHTGNYIRRISDVISCPKLMTLADGNLASRYISIADHTLYLHFKLVLHQVLQVELQIDKIADFIPCLYVTLFVRHPYFINFPS